MKPVQFSYILCEINYTFILHAFSLRNFIIRDIPWYVLLLQEESKLLNAAMCGDIELVSKTISDGIDVNCFTDDEVSAA